MFYVLYTICRLLGSMVQSGSHNLSTLVIVVVNVLSVVGIIVLSKRLFQLYDFHYPVFLLVCHQLSTAVALALATLPGLQI